MKTSQPGHFALPATAIDSRSVGRPLLDLKPARRLTGKEESLDELIFAAQDKIGESLKPLAFRHVRLCIQPAGEENELVF